LPKRLDFITAFAVRNVEYWKKEGQTGNLEDYFRYNARDGWATANTFISLISEVPDYAITNYCQEFPLVFPCHQAEMTGIQIDLVQLEKLKKEQEEKLLERKTSLGIMTKSPISKKTKEYLFNPSSIVQVARLMKVLGCDTAKGTGEIQLKKAMFQHSLNTKILGAILEYRKARKLVSTYLVPEKFWKGRCYYALNPHGTDTARLASTESQFAGWGKDTTLAGLQIHNIPRDRDDIEIKSMFMSDTGFLFGEGDYEQAEARDVAYLSGDQALLDTVESGKDFHSVNVERFFGVPYAEIYDDTTGDILNIPLRYLSKRVNHGSNYNMGWQVLIDTMGLENIYRAQKLLKLNQYWGPRKIAEFLLEAYSNAYPTIKTDYYDSIKYSVATTRKLISPLGWVRYCFSDPSKNKQALNSYVAHPSQNLNAGCLNKAWMRVFKEVAIKEPKDFKLCAQIHDSIIFQYKIGRTDLVRRVQECMLFSIRVKDCKGIERDFRVPVAMKAEANRWSEIKTFK
jgi:DNA polymerase I-like protein with 3'-5' exonuclease and polymerase domains